MRRCKPGGSWQGSMSTAPNGLAVFRALGVFRAPVLDHRPWRGLAVSLALVRVGEDRSGHGLGVVGTALLGEHLRSPLLDAFGAVHVRARTHPAVAP